MAQKSSDIPEHERHRLQNRARLQSLKSCLTSQKWKAFSAVPFLIHYNLASLPGSDDHDVPTGFAVANFDPDMTSSAGGLFSEMKNAAPPKKAAFLGLYAMGSVGSVCFTSASDIDYWLVYSPGALNAAGRETMERKLRAIEKWAMETAGLETHFYLHDIEEIRTARFADDKEFAGDFGALLKDEFLRTSTFVAGAEPLHWGITGQFTADFGSIPHLNTSQYLAACLMLLEKAFDRPFKAALKIGLLRKLAAHPEDKLPAEKYLEGIGEGDKSDHYLFLLRYLWEHFESVGAVRDFLFLKSALFLKTVAEDVSPERRKLNAQRLVSAGFQEIGPPADLKRLENFYDWPLEERIRFSDDIASFLQASLKEIAGYPDAKNLDPRKIRGLTKKILLRRQVRREGAGGLVEGLTFTEVPSRGEKSLSFVRSDADGEWMLSLDRLAHSESGQSKRILKSAPSPVPLLAFALKNNLYEPERTEVRAHPSELFPGRVGELAERLKDFLAWSVPAEALEEESRPEKHLLVVTQPNPKSAEQREVTLFTRTTWGSVEYHCFSDRAALVDAMNTVLISPPPISGVELVTDYVSGPLAGYLAKGLMGSFAIRENEVVLLKEGTRFLLIRDRNVMSADSPFELLLAMGRQGGRFYPRDLPADGVRILFREILQPPENPPAVKIYRFHPARDTVGFFLIDHSGHCHGWEVREADADYAIIRDIDHIKSLSPDIRVLCREIEFRDGVAEPWIFNAMVPRGSATEAGEEQNEGIYPAGVSAVAAIRFAFEDAAHASVSIGTQRFEKKRVADALRLIANFIRAARKKGHSYPAFLTFLDFPDGMAARLSLADAIRMKQELEARIDMLLAER